MAPVFCCWFVSTTSAKLKIMLYRIIQGDMVGSVAVSQFQGPRFNPELGLLSLWYVLPMGILGFPPMVVYRPQGTVWCAQGWTGFQSRVDSCPISPKPPWWEKGLLKTNKWMINIQHIPVRKHRFYHFLFNNCKCQLHSQVVRGCSVVKISWLTKYNPSQVVMFAVVGDIYRRVASNPKHETGQRRPEYGNSCNWWTTSKIERDGDWDQLCTATPWQPYL